MIKRNLLTHSATAYEVTGRDMDGNELIGNETTLENVRVVFNDRQINGGQGKAPGSTATLYFDTTISKPAGFIPVKNMQIEHNGRHFVINDVKPAIAKNSKPEFYKAFLNG